MAKISIDGVEIDVPAEYTLLQACEEAGKEIPRFCYHERLSVAGNCRMCLVEVKGGPPKPTASCAMAVKDLRPGPNGEAPVVLTNSPMVKKAREGVMEFMLINHPLDCPICDQGGECDLQDQALAFGVDSSRFGENKHAVANKYIGVLVKTEMTRCIHCTRCVRFTAEVAGTCDMGAIGRGEDTEITTYLETAMTSELQGNIADLCPVGALLPRPQNFRARPWEYVKTETIDVMDALGSAIRVDTRGREVMRIMPRLNEDVNEIWISDKTRQVVDGLRAQRLDRPYLRDNGKLRAASWGEAFAAIAARVKAAAPERIGAIAGDLASVEEMFALKALMDKLGVSNIDCRQDGVKLDPKFGRASYIFNATVAGIEQADAILIVGSNPRRESPVLNARILKRWRQGGARIALIGEKADLTYAVQHLGAGPDTLSNLGAFGDVLAKAARPMVVVGQGALARADGLAVLAERPPNWRSATAGTAFACCIRRRRASAVSTSASRAGRGRPRCCGHGRGRRRSTCCSTWAPTRSTSRPGAFVVYQGSHGDRGAHRADVILPTARPIPKSREPTSTRKAACRSNSAPPSRRARPARTGRCLRALSAVARQALPFDSLAELRAKLRCRPSRHMAAFDAMSGASRRCQRWARPSPARSRPRRSSRP
jgi:NADH-quinone oxidoreductase subunit G